MAYAIQNGNFGSASTWDTGIVPTGSENAYANGFTIQVNGTQSCGAVRNDASDYYLPITSIPLMTSSTSPSGIVSASGQVVGFEGWRAFDRNTTTLWQTTAGTTTGTLSYQFPSSKIIKRYSFRNAGAGVGARNFTFEASNDGSSWTTLDTQTSINVGTNGIFTSGLLANTTAYLYYRINVTTVNGGTTIQMAEFEMTESTSTVVGQTTGGTFNLNNGSILTCTAATGVYVGSATPTITCSLGTGNSATVNATIPSITAVANYAAVQLSGLGTLNFLGNISCGPISASNMRVINITAAGTLNYNGVCTNGGNTGNQTNSIYSSAGANINIITSGFAGGNVTTTTNASVYLSAGGNLSITNSGTVTGGQSPAVVIIGGNLVITGSLVAGANAPAIQNITTVTPLIDVTGSVIAASGSNAIVSLGSVKVTGSITNVNQFMAVYAPKMLIDSTTNWRFQQSAGADITLYAPGANVGNPATSDVRFGVSYGLGTFTGTLRVPTAATVLLGNLVDATTGTYTPSSPADFVTELNTSTASVAVRLQNCATVATTGDQIASYGV